MVARLAAVLLVAVILTVWRLKQSYTREASTLEGARAALESIAEWAKWMSGIQTATLGGISWLLTNPEDATLKSLVEPRLTFALAGFVLTGLGLLCCAWVLSAIPSVLGRIHGIQRKEPNRAFDVHEMRMFAAKSPRLGNMMALQHWLWASGLICFGCLILWP
jgi:hypothetical protein